MPSTIIAGLPKEFYERYDSEKQKEIALWVIKIIVSILIQKGSGKMDLMKILAGLKALIVGLGLEDDLCARLQSLVDDTSNPFDDQLLQWLQDQWAQL